MVDTAKYRKKWTASEYHNLRATYYDIYNCSFYSITSLATVLPSRGPPGKPHFKVRLPAGPLRIIQSVSEPWSHQRWEKEGLTKRDGQLRRQQQRRVSRKGDQVIVLFSLWHLHIRRYAIRSTDGVSDVVKAYLVWFSGSNIGRTISQNYPTAVYHLNKYQLRLRRGLQHCE